ncbi:lysosomal Pro-X carboxypeptidase-like [Artibeus jamaicensis]|uniref:lysosomal Pro-X carboxypeptidase-like n=1 Tax=Artibeus jamaicensis TaxID=9417 RepID=UPI00235A5739|nr:lysosomal Pro-X carboxypeptidase-like [Artibeus jamaicensis]
MNPHYWASSQKRAEEAPEDRQRPASSPRRFLLLTAVGAHWEAKVTVTEVSQGRAVSSLGGQRKGGPGDRIGVDHFGFKTDKTFKQRYLIAAQQWQKGGRSILFYTGNEGDMIWFCNNTGFMWDVAEEMKALLVFAEHRYCGKSLPFGANTPKDSRHLNFLTSEQALADFGELIKHLKRTILGAANQPVIALGGSYGGMLAAWFRMKYPHVVVGVLGMAPVYQLCGGHKAFQEIITFTFSGGVHGLKGQNLNIWVQSCCMTLDKLFNFFVPYFSLDSSGLLSQACTEMVMPFCTKGIDDMFEPHLWDLKEFSDDCFKQWGVKPRPSWITTMYGGKNIGSHTNIIFSNGDLDPWSGGGVTKNITDTLVAITIPEGAHHLDLRANNAFDPETLLLARSLEVKYLKQWIRDFYASLRKTL